MENQGFQEEAAKNMKNGSVELREVRLSASTMETCAATEVVGHTVVPVSPPKFSSQNNKLQNPGHRLKNVFLIAIIVLLVLWAVMYSVFSKS
jgi:hypothetical protein